MKPNPMLMIPGPTPVPEAVLEVLARPPIGHRSPEFKTVLKDVYTNLQWVFQTSRPVFLYTASGTGAMEAALINTLNTGDEIVVLSCGVFSQRWAEIAKTLGLKIHLLEAPAGKPNLPEDLKAFLTGPNGAGIKAVCMIHSETSTGVMNPVKELVDIVKAHSEALTIVDTVTSLGATDFPTDAWGVDIAVSGSQKGFMITPGLSFLVASEKAMAAHQNTCVPGYYFNFTKSQKSVGEFSTAYTPALSLIRGLGKALELMKEEGIEGVFARHDLNRKMTRTAFKAMGCNLFVPDDTFASPAVTSILPASGLSVDDIRSKLKSQFNITIANGQKDLQGKIFRVGHLGAIFPRDVLMTVASLETVFHQLGFNATPLGTGVKAAQEVFIQHG